MIFKRFSETDARNKDAQKTQKKKKKQKPKKQTKKHAKTLAPEET